MCAISTFQHALHTEISKTLLNNYELILKFRSLLQKIEVHNSVSIKTEALGLKGIVNMSLFKKINRISVNSRNSNRLVIFKREMFITVIIKFNKKCLLYISVK